MSASEIVRSGYVILHRNGRMELDYWDDTLTCTHGKTVTPDEWMKMHRPHCTLHRVEIRVTTSNDEDDKGQECCESTEGGESMSERIKDKTVMDRMNAEPAEKVLSELEAKYRHPKTIAEFEAIYRQEYRQELESCDRWIAWCAERNDTHGMNFHQGMRSAHIFNNINMEQLLRILKGEAPNA